MTILWGGMRCVASKAGAYGAAPRPLQWPISDSFASGSATEPGLKKTVSTTDRLGHLHRWQKIGWRRVAWWILTLPKSCPPIPEIVRVPAVYHSPGVWCVTGARCSCIISKLSRCNSGKRPTPPSSTNIGLRSVRGSFRFPILRPECQGPNENHCQHGGDQIARPIVHPL